MLQKRTKRVVRAAGVGIVVNLLLSLFKAIVGIAAHSIAIILDAINNLTDAISSILTIVGTVFANRRPDSKHPYGYGRIEYMTSLVISIIILYAGVISLIDSVQRIIRPHIADYTALTFAVIIVGIVVKIFMSLFFKKSGTATNSKALLANGVDAMNDVFLTGGTLVAALAALWFHIDIDGWVGAIISFGILNVGIKTMRDSLSPVIGDKVDPQFAKEFEEFMLSYPNVLGVFDLTVDDYGPAKTLAACHIEVPDSMSAREIHELTRRITRKAYEKFGILLIIGIYVTNPQEKFTAEKKTILKAIDHHPGIKSVHALYIDPDSHVIDFDIVVNFNCDGEEVKRELEKELKSSFPGYDFSIVVDLDYSS